MAEKREISAPHEADDHARMLGGGMTVILATISGAIAALAASSCCILPLIFLGLGVSGAWIGNFTRLAPYQPYFIAAAAVSFGVGWLSVYRAPRSSCKGDSNCARKLPDRIMKMALATATVIVLAALSFDYMAIFLPT